MCGAPTSGVSVAIESGRSVAVSPGGGGGVACREESVLGVTLAGPFTSSCSTKVLDPVGDEVGVGGPQDLDCTNCSVCLARFFY